MSRFISARPGRLVVTWLGGCPDLTGGGSPRIVCYVQPTSLRSAANAGGRQRRQRWAGRITGLRGTQGKAPHQSESTHPLGSETVLWVSGGRHQHQVASTATTMVVIARAGSGVGYGRRRRQRLQGRRRIVAIHGGGRLAHGWGRARPCGVRMGVESLDGANISIGECSHPASTRIPSHGRGSVQCSSLRTVQLPANSGHVGAVALKGAKGQTAESSVGDRAAGLGQVTRPRFHNT
ncbi:unnamed protein product [Phaeothamnion confervicola]